MTERDIAIYVDPPSHHFLRDKLFVLEEAAYGGDQLLAPHVAVRDHFAARGIPVHTSDRMPNTPDNQRKFLISFGMRDRVEEWIARPDVTLSAFFAMECPIVEPALYRAMPDLQTAYKRLFSWSDSNTLRPITGADLKLERFCWPQSFDAVHDGLWSREDRKFLVMMNSNKLPAMSWNELYTQRLRAMEHFAEFDEIDLYGRGWDSVPFRMAYGGLPGTVQYALRHAESLWRKFLPSRTITAAQKAWQGAADSKSETMSRYRFAICFENACLKGWITEKIFDCFFAGVVPVYWGDPDIATCIPEAAFIDMREFAKYEELRAYLKALSEQEITDFREAGRAFIESDGYNPFRKQTFVELIARVIEEDSGVKLGP